MKKIILFFTIVTIVFPNCTKVDERVFDRYEANQFFSDPKGPDIALASVYAQMPNFGGG